MLTFACVADTTAHSNAIEENFGGEPLLQSEKQGTAEAMAYLCFDPLPAGFVSIASTMHC